MVKRKPKETEETAVDKEREARLLRMMEDCLAAVGT